MESISLSPFFLFKEIIRIILKCRSGASWETTNDYALRSSMIPSATSRPETIAVGTPVPGWVLAPTKYRFS